MAATPTGLTLGTGLRKAQPESEPRGTRWGGVQELECGFCVRLRVRLHVQRRTSLPCTLVGRDQEDYRPAREVLCGSWNEWASVFKAV